MAKDQRTIIVGGGIVGVCAAYELARRGRDVLLLEQNAIGSGASFGNAGIIAIGHPPLPRPGLAIKVLRWMIDGSSPLYIPPRFDPEMIRWFWIFHRSCTAERFQLCMKVLADLGRLSQDCFERILADESIDCEYHRDGWMEVFRTEAGFETGRHEAGIVRNNGFEATELSRAELLDREPAFQDDVVGAVLYNDSAFTDPMRLLSEIASAAQRHGASMREQCSVDEIVVRGNTCVGVRTVGGEFIGGGTLVLAAGIWSTKLAKLIGIDVPMQAGKGYHRNVRRPKVCLGVASVFAEEHVAATPMADMLRLAGTVEFSGINNKMVQRRLDMMSQSARTYLRGMEQQEVISEWCGLRPCTADGLPVIGWAPNVGGVYIATGHARMGLSLAPGTGEIIAKQLCGEEAPMDISSMCVARFSRRKRKTRDQLVAM